MRLIRHAQSEDEYSRGSDRAGDDHGGESVLGQSLAPAPPGLICGEDVDETSTQVEGEQGADEAGEGEEADAASGPVVGRSCEGAGRSELDDDVPVLLLAWGFAKEEKGRIRMGLTILRRFRW